MLFYKVIFRFLIILKIIWWFFLEKNEFIENFVILSVFLKIILKLLIFWVLEIFGNINKNLDVKGYVIYFVSFVMLENILFSGFRNLVIWFKKWIVVCNNSIIICVSLVIEYFYKKKLDKLSLLYVNSEVRDVWILLWVVLLVNILVVIKEI